MKTCLLLLCISLTLSSCGPKIQSIQSTNRLTNLRQQTIDYTEGSTPLEGYLVYDASRTNVTSPTVIVVHEWMGLNDFSKRQADSLAALGYVAFAADIYGKGVRPTSPQEAGAQATIYRNDRALYRRRLNAALDFINTQPQVDRNKIAAIGYCFGGTGALELARSGANIMAAVSIHGGLSTPKPQDARNIKAKVLVQHGAEDPNVPPAEVQAFMDEMKSAGVDYQFQAFSNAVHAFTNPAAGNDKSKGAAYNPVAAKRAWDNMLLFFANDAGLKFDPK
jgi:dienelactone hydrolase